MCCGLIVYCLIIRFILSGSSLRKLLLAGLFGAFAAGELHGQTAADSARIYYRRGHREVDIRFRENGSELERFIGCVREVYETGRLEGVEIRSYASPDGTDRLNETLSRRRADSLASYIARRAGIPGELIRARGEGVAWELLRGMVASSDMHCRDEVLDILDNTPLWIFDGAGRIVDGRKKRLMDLRGGVPYNYMAEHFFPGLRTGFSAVIRLESGPDVPAESLSAAVPTAAACADGREADPAAGTGCASRSEAAAVPSREIPDTSSPGGPSDASRSGAAESPSSEMETSRTDPAVRKETTVAEREPLHRLAVKTNLLYDAVLMPSLEVEYRIDDRWSVNLEGDVAWWKNDGRHRYYQLATVSPEGRYWFGTRKPWHGHYVGVFGGFSWYDLENGARGYRGEAETVGLSYGYMFPVGRSLSFEAGIGIGYMHSEYEEYLPIDGHYVYQQTSRMNYFGPLKLKFALVWRLWNTDGKKGGVR